MASEHGHDPGADPQGQPDIASARRRVGWRFGTPLAVLLSGALFVVSAANSEGTDLRPGRYVDLATLVQNESDSYQELQAEATELQAEVNNLTQDVDDEQVRRKQGQADELRDDAGLEPVAGAGVTVVLSDAPSDLIEQALSTPELNLNLLVVHQQDIQAVVNAMWAGGATAVTIQGQRVVSTTGIKCRGSAVQLQGVPYPQPYTIQAVGDPAALGEALLADDDVSRFRADTERAEVGVGFDARAEELVEAPAYDGLLGISYAQPVR
ncbi:MAG: DUF881 domain-containing protein [Nocardioides sp.]